MHFSTMKKKIKLSISIIIFDRLTNLYYPNNEKSDLNNSKKTQYFYLNNDMLAIFDGNYYLYIINITYTNSSLKKIKLNLIKDKYISPKIKDVIYSKVNQNEYLYISLYEEDKKTENVVNEIIYGIII